MKEFAGVVVEGTLYVDVVDEQNTVVVSVGSGTTHSKSSQTSESVGTTRASWDLTRVVLGGARATGSGARATGPDYTVVPRSLAPRGPPSEEEEGEVLEATSDFPNCHAAACLEAIAGDLAAGATWPEGAEARSLSQHEPAEVFRGLTLYDPLCAGDIALCREGLEMGGFRRAVAGCRTPAELASAKAQLRRFCDESGRTFFADVERIGDDFAAFFRRDEGGNVPGLTAAENDDDGDEPCALQVIAELEHSTAPGTPLLDPGKTVLFTRLRQYKGRCEERRRREAEFFGRLAYGWVNTGWRAVYMLTEGRVRRFFPQASETPLLSYRAQNVARTLWRVAGGRAARRVVSTHLETGGGGHGRPLGGPPAVENMLKAGIQRRALQKLLDVDPE
eukprot:g12565.t1